MKNKKIISPLIAALTIVFILGSYAAPVTIKAQGEAPPSIPEYVPYEERIEDLQKSTWTNLNSNPENCQQAIAQGQPCQIPQTKLNNVGGVLKLIQYITNWMFTGLLVLSVLMIIIAAYHYLFSGGDEEGTSKAKKYLIYTVIAIAVAMLAKGVTFIVAEILM
jgi:hypothetical protein